MVVIPSMLVGCQEGHLPVNNPASAILKGSLLEIFLDPAKPRVIAQKIGLLNKN